MGKIIKKRYVEEDRHTARFREKREGEEKESEIERVGGIRENEREKKQYSRKVRKKTRGIRKRRSIKREKMNKKG